MNVLSRDLKMNEVVVCEDGTYWEVGGGNGMKSAGKGQAVFGYPIDPITKERVGEMARIDADISLDKTEG